MRERVRSTCLLLTLALLAAPACQSPDLPKKTEYDQWEDALLSDKTPKQFAITGAVVGCTGDYRVIVELHNRSTFAHGSQVARLAFEPAAVHDGRIPFTFNAPISEYCIRAYEDMNRDGTRTRTWDRAEPVGYYRDYWMAWPPRFANVRFQLLRDLNGIEIRLR